MVSLSGISDLAAGIAEVIGGVEPSLIEEIIAASNHNGLAFHGVKDPNNVNSVNNKGIMPLTPEGGWASYWTSGFRLFSSYPDRVETFDTTFFHYGSGAIAVARPVEGFKRDGYFALKRPVPRSEVHMIIPVVNLDGLEGRARGQARERAMLYALHQVVVDAFNPGYLITVTGNGSSSTHPVVVDTV